jgi:hypothetical protein
MASGFKLTCLDNNHSFGIKVYALLGEGASMTSKPRLKHGPEKIVAKLRYADGMLNAGKDLAAVLQALEISEATLARWRAGYGGMKSEEAKRLKTPEDQNRRLKQLVADQALDIQMLKHLSQGHW